MTGRPTEAQQLRDLATLRRVRDRIDRDQSPYGRDYNPSDGKANKEENTCLGQPEHASPNDAAQNSRHQNGVSRTEQHAL